MKKLNLLLLITLSLLFSCKDDDSTPDDASEKEAISAKWVVNDNDTYQSFEFNKSYTYIVVKVDQVNGAPIVLFGNYNIVDSKTVELEDFGTIEIDEIDDNSISFALQVDGEDKVNISAAKQAEMNNSTRTELLCRTWQMVTVNGEEVTGTEFDLTVLFSQAGTYFVELANPDDENEGGLASWKWYDDTETHFLYSWGDPAVWDEEDIVEVVELTDNSLKILEIYSNGDEELYEMAPANSKSSRIMSNASDNNIKLKRGFLKH
ncbi:hypothetical protein LVD15_10160 [Fulvivirga maritima]|uniref:hypothetical protein n=1 Tax=Fulvivirga maritima TaxID=2904247 RepID=UPI001F32FE64|nr:hypothetical protein [Fulvivirga maritima]UII28765.1 hypothetical protein LVD15_10160 [Fulvivirga maritima]